MENNNVYVAMDHEILMELLDEKRERDRRAKMKRVAKIIIACLVIIAIGISIPRILEMYHTYTDTMKNINTLTAEVDGMINTYSGTIQKISEIDLDSIMDTLTKANNLLTAIGSFFGF